MAAYFVKLKYGYNSRDGVEYDGDCIITYDKFERVDEDSFYNKLKEHFKYADVIQIVDVVKL